MSVGRCGESGRSESPMCGRQTKRRSGAEAVCVRCGCCRQHSPRLLVLPLYAPASVHTLQYQLRDTVPVFTLRWRPSSCHRHAGALQRRALNVAIILSQSALKNDLSVRPPLRLSLLFYVLKSAGGKHDSFQARDIKVNCF